MRLTPSFVVALAVWMGAFVLITRLGTWAPLAFMGPLLAMFVLVRDVKARELLRPTPLLVMIGLAMGAAMSIATYVLYALFSHLSPQLQPLTVSLYAELHAPGFTRAQRAVLIPLVAIAEEIVFRGTILPNRDVGARVAVKAVAFNSLIVGVAHLASGNWLLALVAALTAIVWGGLRVATRSSVPSILTHVIWDLSILVFWPLT